MRNLLAREGRSNPWNHPFRRLKLDATLLGGLQDSSSEVNQSMDISEWVEAKYLKSGDLTFTANGKLQAISSVQVENRDETVYNFEVEDFHTYFVGEVGVWVHNDSYLSNPSVFNLAKRLMGITPDQEEVNTVFDDPKAAERFELGKKYAQLLSNSDGTLERSVERLINGEKLTESDLLEIDKIADENADKLGLQGKEREAFKAGIRDQILFDRKIEDIHSFVGLENDIATSFALTAAPFFRLPSQLDFLNKFGIGRPSTTSVVQQEVKVGSTVITESSRINADSVKSLSKVVNQISQPSSRLTVEEFKQLEKLTTQFGGKIRYDLNPVKGKVIHPHVQIENLTPSIKRRHIYLSDEAVNYLRSK